MPATWLGSITVCAKDCTVWVSLPFSYQDKNWTHPLSLSFCLIFQSLLLLGRGQRRYGQLSRAREVGQRDGWRDGLGAPPTHATSSRPRVPPNSPVRFSRPIPPPDSPAWFSRFFLLFSRPILPPEPPSQVASGSRVIVTMEHTDKEGKSKVVGECSLPLTGRGTRIDPEY